jgi:two-component sensor histidine kinase
LCRNTGDAHDFEQDGITPAVDLELDRRTAAVLGPIVDGLITNAVKHVSRTTNEGRTTTALPACGEVMELPVTNDDWGSGLRRRPDTASSW